MSFIESLLLPEKRRNVPCQTDSEYSEISSNQCSWCAAEFANHCDELKTAFFASDDSFIGLYKECMKSGSLNRKTYKKSVYGENIDNKTLKNVTKLSVCLECTYVEGDDILRNELMILLPDDLKKEFYTNAYIRATDFEFIKSYKFTLVSRHGQSLCLLNVGGSFIVLDSHVRTVGMMTYENTVKYMLCKVSEPAGYTMVTCLCG